MEQELSEREMDPLPTNNNQPSFVERAAAEDDAEAKHSREEAKVDLLPEDYDQPLCVEEAEAGDDCRDERPARRSEGWRFEVVIFKSQHYLSSTCISGRIRIGLVFLKTWLCKEREIS